MMCLRPIIALALIAIILSSLLYVLLPITEATSISEATQLAVKPAAGISASMLVLDTFENPQSDSNLLSRSTVYQSKLFTSFNSQCRTIKVHVVLVPLSKLYFRYLESGLLVIKAHIRALRDPKRIVLAAQTCK